MSDINYMLLQQELNKLFSQLRIKRFEKQRHTKRITILAYLQAHPEGTNPSQLAEELNLARPHITKTIENFENAGYLQRNLSNVDKRRFDLFITVGGQRELDELMSKDIARAKNLGEYLGEADSMELIRLLGRINPFITDYIPSDIDEDNV